MKCYIDGYLQPSNYFWAAIQGLANDAQRIWLLNGDKLLLGGRTYEVWPDDGECVENTL